MKVSRRSWHWRLRTFFWQSLNWEANDPWEAWRLIARRTSLDVRDPRRPKNLCRYFWSIVGLSIASIIIILIVGLFSVAVIIVVGPFAWVISKYLDSAGHWRRAEAAKARRAAKPSKSPGLLRSFLKAKKSKVCPIIELED